MSDFELRFLEDLEHEKFVNHTVCICPILEYACPAFHDSITTFLSNDLAMIQRERALRKMFPWVPYDEALNIAGIHQLNV